MTPPKHAKEETADTDEAVEAVAEETAEEPTESEAVANSDADEAAEPKTDDTKPPKRRIAWNRVLAYGVLPGLALLLAMAAGYLKWLDTSARDAQTARIESVRVASDSTTAILTYKADTVEKDLGSAQDRLTGPFKESYNALIRDVVVPQAKDRKISAVTSVPAAASVSASAKHAVVLVFVNQTVTVGTDPPSNTGSSVRVTLDKIDGKWLISDFTPV